MVDKFQPTQTKPNRIHNTDKIYIEFYFFKTTETMPSAPLLGIMFTLDTETMPSAPLLETMSTLVTGTMP